MLDLTSTVWTSTPLRDVHLHVESEVRLSEGLSLIRTNESLLSARTLLSLSKTHYEAIGRVSWFLVLQTPMDANRDTLQLALRCFEDSLMAFQMVKPIETFGVIFQGEQNLSSDVLWRRTNVRQPMNAGQWARLRAFDEALLQCVPPILGRVQTVMAGSDIAKRNAVHLLQLALEHPHPYIACLLAVAGMEAILDSQSRWDFEKKLCDTLGTSTPAFPNWNSPHFPPLKYTIKELAIHLYTLRSKVAHGVDLAKAATDRLSPVDLFELKEYIPEGEPAQYATLLSESSIYLLGQLLLKIL